MSECIPDKPMLLLAKMVREWDESADALKPAKPTVSPESIKEARSLLENPSSTATMRPRTTYVPLTQAQIDHFREHGQVEEQGMPPSKVIDLLCDMASSSLLYGEEIHRLRDGPSAASAIATPKLDKPALVGNTRFGVGIEWRTVIERAQREHDYQVTPEKEAARIGQGKDFFASIRQQAEQAQDSARYRWWRKRFIAEGESIDRADELLEEINALTGTVGLDTEAALDAAIDAAMAPTDGRNASE